MKTAKAKFTRADYISGSCTHRQYYGQFVNGITRELVERYIGRDAIMASKDVNFNDIPLARWDSLARGGLPRAFAFKDVADIASLAGEVCLAKEAARQIKEGA